MLKYSIPENWYQNCYVDKGAVINAARSFSIVSASKKAILLIHGYAGYPGELVRPAQDLAPYFDIYVPRLPGNGTTGEDFQKATVDDYLTLIENAYKDLESQYEEVYLLGHSMGTLLAIETAKKFKTKKIVLSAPALKFKGVNLLELKAISLVNPVLKNNAWKQDLRYHLHYENAPCDDLKLADQYWRFIYVKKLIEALNLAKKARATIKELNNCEILCLQAEHDALVDNDISSYLPKNATVSLIKGATHFMYYDIDTNSEEDAVKQSVEFFKG